MAYGYGTRSWMRSTEFRQMKREIAETKAKVSSGELVIPTTQFSVLCECRSFRYPHELMAHKRLRSEMDWCSYQERERRETSMQEWV